MIHTPELFAIFQSLPPSQCHRSLHSRFCARSRHGRFLPGALLRFPAGCFGERERERKKERGKRRSKDSGGGSVSPAQPHFNSKTLLRKAGREPLQHRLKAQQFPSITHPCLAGSITQPKACRQTEGVKLVISQLRSEWHRKCSNLHFILRIILTLRSQARDNAEAVPATVLKHRDGNKTQVVFQDRH